jgi:hypothetical protein
VSLRKGRGKPAAQMQSARLELLNAVYRELGVQSRQMSLSRRLVGKIEDAIPVRRGIRKIGSMISHRPQKSFGA